MTAATAVLIWSGAAHAGIVLSYPTFTGACASSLTCFGNTAESATVLRLTPAAVGKVGTAYSTTPITLGAGAKFSTTFRFQITAAGGLNPADGFTFVLAANPTGLGIPTSAGGGGLGYVGVPNSFAVEFDTYNNLLPDLTSNHVAIDVNGALSNIAATNPYGVAPCDFFTGYTQVGCMANGDVWTVVVNYDGTRLDVAVQDGTNLPQMVISALPINIAAVLGTNTVFAGFTGATGDGYETQDILSWQFADDTSILSQIDTDEDGIADTLDNCRLVANPDQRDTNGDGYGNICDPDFDNNGTVNINDFNRMKARLNIIPVVDVDTDLDGDGVVNINDFNRLKSFLGNPPGP
jgi:hypothetical protein